MDERMALCWLAIDEKIELPYKHKLLLCFGSALNVYQAQRRDLLGCGILRADQAEHLLKAKDKKLEEWTKKLKNMKMGMVTLLDKNYPVHLKHTTCPPLLLYYKGICNGEIFERTLAVVGSRRASLSGRENTKKIVRDLASCGLTIVSGLALGIDTQAHMAALDACGNTVAVLGCGIDRCYPKENRFLMDSIIDQGGVILSEFLPGTPPLASNFPMRNRIISGMSLGVLVAEAGMKSGSLITARYAAEQGREVYAFPGDLDRRNALGSNRLIKDGAKMVLSAMDVLEDMSPMFSQRIPVGE